MACKAAVATFRCGSPVTKGTFDAQPGHLMLMWAGLLESSRGSMLTTATLCQTSRLQMAHQVLRQPARLP